MPTQCLRTTSYVLRLKKNSPELMNSYKMALIGIMLHKEITLIYYLDFLFHVLDHPLEGSTTCYCGYHMLLPTMLVSGNIVTE